MGGLGVAFPLIRGGLGVAFLLNVLVGVFRYLSRQEASVGHSPGIFLPAAKYLVSKIYVSKVLA